MVRIGIIGTGRIANRAHANSIASVSGSATLVAAADIVPERLEEFCNAFNVPRRYQDAADLIADPEVDLVAIATPPDAHEALAVAALEHGKYVLCEKPLAHSLASAHRIAEAEARHPGRLAVCHQMRYDASRRRLIWLCQNGWIGEIQSALIERHSNIPHTNHGKGGWWGVWNIAGGGVLLTQLIHELDLLVLTMGRPVSVSAEMDTRYTGIESEDHIDATFRFAEGRSARCIASVNSGRTGGGIVIQGSRGSVGLPGDVTMDDQGRLSQALAALNLALPDTRPPSSSIVSRGKRFLARHLGVKERPELTPHARIYQDIAQHIETGSPLPAPPADAMDSLELCMAAYESAITGTEIKFPLGPTSSVYGGVSRESYDARKCSRSTTEQAASEQ